MRAAIEDLTETRTVTPASTPAPGPARGRRVAVLGDMLELGDEGSRLHCEVGAYAAERGVDVLVTVGPHAAEIADAFAGEAHRVPDADAAAELLGVLLREGDMVLVKGSRGVGLERVAQVLEAEGEAHAGGPPHEQRAQAVDLGERWGERGSNHPAGRR